MRVTTSEFIERLGAIVGAGRVSTARPERDAVGRDCWPRHLIDVAHGRAPDLAPDAVVWPGSAEEVAQVVAACGEAGVAVVPFGAGSGVCGGTLPPAGSITIDLKRLAAIRSMDPAAGTIEVEAGLVGELLERRLAREGLTLGHFPSSILCSTVGGWLATRSAGQCSSRYGKIEDMVIDLEVVTGDGVLRRTPPVGASGLGPDWNQLFVGSEGTFGIITAATLRVHAQPAARRFRGWRVPSYQAGLEVMRGAMQAGLRPAVLRLYDPLDTLIVGSNPDDAPPGGGRALARIKALLGDALDGDTELKQKAMQTALAHPRVTNLAVSALPEPCLLVSVCEGADDEARAEDETIAQLARAAGAADLGEGPGRAWFAHRYDVSFKMNRIYASGAFADTFEVATTWGALPALYDAMRKAMSPHVLVLAHFSHAYPGGCSIYFSLVGTGRDADEMRARYDAAWEAGLAAAAEQKAAIAHHHGVGLSRARYNTRVHGAALRWFECLKPVLDPHGILNPGKVFAGSLGGGGAS